MVRILGGVPIPEEMFAILEGAYAPCPGYAKICKACGIRFAPADGHVPRGFVGGFSGAGDVRLIVVGAEPGDPYHGANHAADGTAPLQLSSSLTETAQCHENGRDDFHQNMRYLLQSCWPGLSFEEQLCRTWITGSVLCSAPQEGKNVKRPVWRECREHYLKKQLDCFPSAFVVALGAKAKERLGDIIGNRKWTYASAVAPPEAKKRSARESWEQAAHRFREFVTLSNTD